MPGDVLGSGTIGRGCGLELDRWIKPGDVVELEVEGIGVLAQPCRAPVNLSGATDAPRAHRVSAVVARPGTHVGTMVCGDRIAAHQGTTGRNGIRDACSWSSTEREGRATQPAYERSTRQCPT